MLVTIDDKKIEMAYTKFDGEGGTNIWEREVFFQSLSGFRKFFISSCFILKKGQLSDVHETHA